MNTFLHSKSGLFDHLQVSVRIFLRLRRHNNRCRDRHRTPHGTYLRHMLLVKWVHWKHLQFWWFDEGGGSWDRDLWRLVGYLLDPEFRLLRAKLGYNFLIGIFWFFPYKFNWTWSLYLLVKVLIDLHILRRHDLHALFLLVINVDFQIFRYRSWFTVVSHFKLYLTRNLRHIILVGVFRRHRLLIYLFVDLVTILLLDGLGDGLLLRDDLLWHGGDRETKFGFLSLWFI